MSSSRLVRGAKTRMFAIVCLVCVLGAVVLVFHGTQSKLVEVQRQVDSCNQQQESLSAQLQVIFEYKVRLEKSLTKEKEDHKQTKDTLEAKLKEEKENREKDIKEAKNKYEALVQQNKDLQNRLYELKENEDKEISKLKEENQELRKEVSSLKKGNEDLLQKGHNIEDLKSEYLKKLDEVRTLRKENEDLKTQMNPEGVQKLYCEKEKSEMKDDLEKTRKVLELCEETNRADSKPKPDSPNTNVGEMPKLIYNGSKAANGSTTPGLNPDAVNNFDVSSPKPLRDVEPPVAKPSSSEQGAQLHKKPTQESVAPIAFPREQQQQQAMSGGLDQIPVPGVGLEPRGKDPLGNTLQKPNTGNGVGQGEEPGPAFVGQMGGGEPDGEQPKLYVPAPLDEDDHFQKQGEIPRMKNPEHYPHGGDYERDQPEDEEDDEGEQMDYDEHKKDQKNSAQQLPVRNPPAQINEEPGVMVNPK